MSQIRIQEQKNGVIFHLKGQFIGGDETDRLRELINNISEAENNHLIINMEKTTYLNSTALGVLISAHASFVKHEGRMIICNISKSLENIFVITKLTKVFNIKDTLEEAIKLISN